MGEEVLAARKDESIHNIEIKIKKISQLFNSLDPSPFLEKDLDDDAAEYITSSVSEKPLKSRQKIVIYLPKKHKKISEIEIRRAIHNFFEYKKIIAERNIRLQIQEGQLSLVIGIIFLATCLVGNVYLIDNFDSFAAHILAEGLLIGGWVSMWKPISNILYDWWPLYNEKNIFRKISDMEIEFVYE